MTLVDTNVLLDIATNDPKWAAWSLRRLDAAAIRGPVLINAVVYAELSIGYARIEEVDKVLADATSSSRRRRARLSFWRARRFSVIGRNAARARACCPIFSSARTRLSRDTRC